MIQDNVTRRRVLQMCAAVPFAGLGKKAIAAAPVARWQGVALGAQAQVILAGVTQDEAAPVFSALRDEIARLEGIFSLYQSRSSISRLNANGSLKRPEPELLEVLSLSRRVWLASQGAFDPTVQSLWSALAEQGQNPVGKGDFGDLRFSADEVVLKQGMSVTLNGIAQGYITDRVTALLRKQGLGNVAVDAGEQRVSGTRPDGRDWRLAVVNKQGDMVRQLSLRDHALATSSPLGTRLPGGAGHILDPRSGRPARIWETVSISHHNAAVADALSTASCCLERGEINVMLSQFKGAKVEYQS